MADNAEGSSDAQITFKVKTGGDKTHTITMSEGASVLELKKTLAGEQYENVAADRQRLIYSGRVMKNDDPLSTYKIKPNNTIHMVKSAASNPTPQSSAGGSTPTPAAVPQNMAAGVANNPLAGLTGARYAGHVNLPSRDMFGADGGMGAPPSDDQMAQMLSDPSMLQTMNAALDNPQFIDYMIQSNPQLRNMPNARDIIQSPWMRQMMTNPDMLRNVMRMQRNMMGGQGGGGSFPAPGATDNTPSSADGEGNNGSGAAPNPFASPDLRSSPGNLANMPQMLQAMTSQLDTLGRTPEDGNPGTGTGTGTPGGTNNAGQSPPPANPFAALFPPQGGQGGQGGLASMINPEMMQQMAANPEMMSQMLSMFGGGGMGGGLGGMGGGAAAPADNRPPEERYEDQLRQLNDMGFFDFDRNVAALRRSGGSVQGAVEYLLTN